MRKIIIVDDSTDLLEILKFFLEERGYQVLTLATSQELMPAIKTFLPDLIILDIYLQGEDGREVCKKLRNQYDTKYLCILMFSASPKALADYKTYGADGYIEKPFGLNEIVTKIDTTLDKCRNYVHIHN